MSTSNVPTRSRSLRKPTERGSRLDPPATTDGQSTQSRSGSAQSPSRLPVKPLSRTATGISTSISTNANTTATATTPRTMTPSSTATTTRSASAASTNGSMRPPVTRSSISRPLVTSRLSSGTTTSNQPQSSSTLTQEPSKQERSTTRPPLTTRGHLRNASTSSVTGQLPTRPSAGAHARTRSTTTLTPTTTLRPPSRPTEERRIQTAAAPVETRVKKPAFTSHQQHFSPAKSLAPKPHPAAFLAPPSPSKLPSNIAITAETARLQNELLQLHLLHRDADQIRKEWQASAKQQLSARFDSIVERNDTVAQLEACEVGKANAIALKDWRDMGTPGWGLEERIQMLDEIVTGVWNLGEPGGKYARTVKRFERWLSRCQDIYEARGHGKRLAADGEDISFIEDLGSSWREDCRVQRRKLDIWYDQLKGLGQLDEGSSLFTMVSGCRSLVGGMLEELSMMAKIERDATIMEADWIKGMNDNVSDDDDDDTEGPKAGAAWRYQ